MDHVQNWTQAYSQTPWRKQVQLIGLFSLVLVFTALVAGVYLNVTARAATAGREIQGLQFEVERMQRENEDLQSKLAFLSSSEVMEKRARELGFTPLQKDQAEYLMVPGYTGRAATNLAPAPSTITQPAAGNPPEYTETLFTWLSRQNLDWILPFAKVTP